MSNSELQEVEMEEEQSFEEIGVDARLIRAMHKKSILIPTPIQRAPIPLILVQFTSLELRYPMND